MSWMTSVVQEKRKKRGNPERFRVRDHLANPESRPAFIVFGTGDLLD